MPISGWRWAIPIRCNTPPNIPTKDSDSPFSEAKATVIEETMGTGEGKANGPFVKIYFMSNRSPYRDALRLLYLLVKGSSPVSESDTSGATAIFRGEARLFAFDFWMRNPDYLADELLNVFEQTGEQSLLDAVKDIFAANEPDIRRYPMIRWKFGAYERLDDTLSILKSRRLIDITRRTIGGQVLETSFLVMPAAVSLTSQITVEFPDLDWYSRRAALVAKLAGERGGAALKEQQHKHIEYHETNMGGIIPAITDRVQARLHALMRSAQTGDHNDIQ